jgi:hypothetical protein
VQNALMKYLLPKATQKGHPFLENQAAFLKAGLSTFLVGGTHH